MRLTFGQILMFFDHAQTFFLKNWFQFVIFEYLRSDELSSQFIFGFSISIVFNIQLTFVWKNILNVLCLLYHLKMFLRSKIMSLFSFPFNCANVGKADKLSAKYGTNTQQKHMLLFKDIQSSLKVCSI